MLNVWIAYHLNEYTEMEFMQLIERWATPYTLDVSAHARTRSLTFTHIAQQTHPYTTTIESKVRKIENEERKKEESISRIHIYRNAHPSYTVFSFNDLHVYCILQELRRFPFIINEWMSITKYRLQIVCDRCMRAYEYSLICVCVCVTCERVNIIMV